MTKQSRGLMDWLTPNSAALRLLRYARNDDTVAVVSGLMVCNDVPFRLLRRSALAMTRYDYKLFLQEGYCKIICCLALHIFYSSSKFFSND
jgi:hypothetical protein